MLPLIRRGQYPGNRRDSLSLIHAFLPPCVVTQVPLDANEPSPGNAGGMLPLMSCHVIPSKGAKIVKHSVDRITMKEFRDAASKTRTRHRNQVEAGSRLDRPGGTAVQCLVNTEISRVIPTVVTLDTQRSR